MIIIVVAVLGILLLSTWLSYVYFSATITNKDLREETIITSGTMRINYAEGNNEGDVEAEYEIYLSEVLNTFIVVN